MASSQVSAWLFAVSGNVHVDNSKTVLLVDDDADVRKTAEPLLRSAGYRYCGVSGPGVASQQPPVVDDGPSHCDLGLERGLAYALNTIDIEIPPLRERTRDILDLAEHFLRVTCRKHGLSTRALDQKLRHASMPMAGWTMFTLCEMRLNALPSSATSRSSRLISRCTAPRPRAATLGGTIASTPGPPKSSDVASPELTLVKLAIARSVYV